MLEALGIRLDLTPAQVAAVMDKVGITFCFAPVFHGALRHSAVPRRELGVATTFNFLGPLANPARPAAQAVGVADARMAGLIAGVLARRGVDGFVFRGDDGLDELTTTTTSHVWTIAGGQVSEEVFDAGRPRPRPLASPMTCAAATSRSTPTSCAASSPASADPCATPCCSTRQRRSPPTTPTSTAAVDRTAGCGVGTARSRRLRAAQAKLDAWVAASRRD